MAKHKYPKSVRLRAKADFRAIIEYKLFSKNDLMMLYMRPNDGEKSRFGVSVKAKTASAVGRNRLKRLAREALRLERENLPAGFDYLIIFSPRLSDSKSCGINTLGLEQVRGCILELASEGLKRFEKRQSKK